MRKEKGTKAKNTERAINRLIEKLKKFREEGGDVAQILNRATDGQWTSVYDTKNHYQKNNQFTKKNEIDIQNTNNMTEEERSEYWKKGSEGFNCV